MPLAGLRLHLRAAPNPNPDPNPNPNPNPNPYPTQVCVSTDRKVWTRVEATTYDQERGAF